MKLGKEGMCRVEKKCVFHCYVKFLDTKMFFFLSLCS